MKEFFKTVLNGLKITVMALAGVSSDCIGLYFIFIVRRAYGWWSILLLLLGIVFILLSVGVYWGIGENIYVETDTLRSDNNAE